VHLKEDAVRNAEARNDEQILENSVVVRRVDLGGGGGGAPWHGNSKEDQGATTATTSSFVGRGSNSKTAAQSPWSRRQLCFFPNHLHLICLPISCYRVLPNR